MRLYTRQRCTSESTFLHSSEVNERFRSIVARKYLACRNGQQQQQQQLSISRTKQLQSLDLVIQLNLPSRRRVGQTELPRAGLQVDRPSSASLHFIAAATHRNKHARLYRILLSDTAAAAAASLYQGAAEYAK